MDEYKVRVEYKLDIETSLWHYRILDDEDNPTTTESNGHESLLDAKAEVLRALRQLGYMGDGVIRRLVPFFVNVAQVPQSSSVKRRRSQSVIIVGGHGPLLTCEQDCFSSVSYCVVFDIHVYIPCHCVRKEFYLFYTK